LCVAVLDLDHFKEVNDLHGHAAGDELLSSMARHWRSQLRDNDVLFRSGGDEFVMLLPDTRLADATRMLARLRESSPAPWCSGIAELRDDDDLDRALARADLALYDAKSHSRSSDRVEIPPPRQSEGAARVAEG